MLLYSIVFTLPCIIMLVWPERQARAVEERIKAGDDRYFEEQRTYRAYPSLRNPRRIRLVGAIGTACGIISCILAVYHG